LQSTILFVIILLKGGLDMLFAVVDDEPEVLEQIPQVIKQFIHDQKIETECFQNTMTFMETYPNRNYDALFLDIDMPIMNGFDLAQKLHEEKDDIPIVYITGCEDLITNAFRYKPLGFVRKQRIYEEMPYALSTILDEISKVHLTIDITETRASGGQTHTVLIDQITFIESVKHNVQIHLANGDILISRGLLSSYIESAGFENFILINPGTIVNLAHIKLIDDTVAFEDGTTLYISRRKFPTVLQSYLKYVKKVLI
jgi:DNA-binding LytR/AlgR family response regulator